RWQARSHPAPSDTVCLHGLGYPAGPNFSTGQAKPWPEGMGASGSARAASPPRATTPSRPTVKPGSTMRRRLQIFFVASCAASPSLLWIRSQIRYRRLPRHLARFRLFHRNAVLFQRPSHSVVESNFSVRVVRHGLDLRALVVVEIALRLHHQWDA